jgi:arsenite transporter
MEPKMQSGDDEARIAARRQCEQMTGDRFCFHALAAALAGFAAAGMLDLRFLNGFIPLAIFMMLYPMMLDVENAKAAEVFKKPGLPAAALFINFLLAPLLIFTISWAFPPKSNPLLTVGMVVFGLIPCGGMVPAYTGALGGNVTLSVVISGASLFLCAGVAPLWMRILLGRWVPFPYTETAGYLLGVIGLPFVLANFSRRVIIGRWGAGAFAEVKAGLRGCVRWGFMALIFIIFSQNGKLLFKDLALIPEIILPASIFLVLLLLFSTFAGKIAGWCEEDATALTVSVSVKNTAVSIAFAASSLGPDAVLAIGIIGPLVQAPIMLCYLALSRRSAKRLKLH